MRERWTKTATRTPGVCEREWEKGERKGKKEGEKDNTESKQAQRWWSLGKIHFESVSCPLTNDTQHSKATKLELENGSYLHTIFSLSFVRLQDAYTQIQFTVGVLSHCMGEKKKKTETHFQLFIPIFVDYFILMIKLYHNEIHMSLWWKYERESERGRQNRQTEWWILWCLKIINCFRVPSQWIL